MAGRPPISAVDRYNAAQQGISLREYQGRNNPSSVRSVQTRTARLLESGTAFGDEAKIGAEFAYRLKVNLLASIARKTDKRSGKALRSNVRPIYQSGYLYALTITLPYYIYPILNNGAENAGKHKVSIDPKNFMKDAMENGRFMEDFANVVGSIRAANIISRFNFNLTD